MDNQVKFSWSFIEDQENPKSRFWAIGMVLFFGTIATLAFIFKNPLFGMIIVIGGITLLGNGLSKGKKIEVKITEKEISTGDSLLEFAKIESFWITNINYPEITPHLLLIQPQKTLGSKLSFPLPDEIDLIALRLFLQTKCEEKEIKGPFLHHIIDQFGI